jgi:hypothetical protein
MKAEHLLNFPDADFVAPLGSLLRFGRFPSSGRDADFAGAISQGGESLGWIEFAKRGRTRVFAYGPKGVVSLKSHRKLRGWPSFMSATTHSPEHFRVQYNLRWLRQWKVPSRECEQWVVPRR